MSKIAFSRRWLLLGLLSCFTLAAAGWVSQDDDTPAPARTTHEPRRKPSVASLHAQQDRARDDLEALPLDKFRQRVAGAKLNHDIFTAKSWYVPPPPPKASKPLPPPPPTAPPLPFTYSGQLLDESGRLVIYLAQGDRAYVVTAGDMIDDLYRVESVTPQQLVLVYLPLSIKQTLSTGTGS